MTNRIATKPISDYDRAVNEWLAERGITFTVDPTGEVKGFSDESREDRHRGLWHDTYRATLTRLPGLTRAVRLDIPTYYQSAAQSASQISRERCKCFRDYGHAKSCPKSAKPVAPSAYDVLSCLQKYDPDTFESFCSDYGYDTDSRRAMNVYLEVQAEWTRVRAFFTSEELTELQEIAS